MGGAQYIYVIIYIHIHTYLSVYLSIYHSISVFIYRSICLPINLSVNLSIYLPICVCVHVHVHVYNVNGIEAKKIDGCCYAESPPLRTGHVYKRGCKDKAQGAKREVYDSKPVRSAELCLRHCWHCPPPQDVLCRLSVWGVELLGVWMWDIRKLRLYNG